MRALMLPVTSATSIRSAFVASVMTTRCAKRSPPDAERTAARKPIRPPRRCRLQRASLGEHRPRRAREDPEILTERPAPRVFQLDVGTTRVADAAPPLYRPRPRQARPDGEQHRQALAVVCALQWNDWPRADERHF